MCFLKPLKVKKINDKKVLLEDGIEAIYNKKEFKLKVGDRVIVFGNLVVEKASHPYQT